MDEMILNAIHRLSGWPVLDWLMIGISRLGNMGFVWVIIALVLLARRNTRRWGLACLCALALSMLFTNLLLKNLWMRPRPYEVFSWLTPLIAPLGGWSFPSGHASASFAAATALWGLGTKWRWPVFALAALISFSRLYVGVHYPTDVLAGLAVGVCCGMFAQAIERAWVKKT